MELFLRSTEGVPEGSIVSIRAGSTRRQAPVSFDKAFRFDQKRTKPTAVKFDLYAPIASTRLVLAPDEDAYSAAFLKPDGAGMVVNFDVRDAQISGKAAAVLEEAQVDGLRESPAKRHLVEVEAAAYLEKHNLFHVMQSVLQAVIKEKPEDPYEYMTRVMQGGRMPSAFTPMDSPVKPKPEAPVPAPTSAAVPAVRYDEVVKVVADDLTNFTKYYSANIHPACQSSFWADLNGRFAKPRGNSTSAPSPATAAAPPAVPAAAKPAGEFNFKPSVGTWLLQPAFSAEDAPTHVQPALEPAVGFRTAATAAFAFSPSVGTWLADSPRRPPGAPEEFTAPAAAWNLSPSVGTWLCPLDPISSTDAAAPAVQAPKVMPPIASVPVPSGAAAADSLDSLRERACDVLTSAADTGVLEHLLLKDIDLFKEPEAKTDAPAQQQVSQPPAKTWQLKPSVGTWLAKKSFRPHATALPAAGISSNVDVPAAQAVMAAAPVTTGAWQLSPSVGTWLAKKPFRAAEVDMEDVGKVMQDRVRDAFERAANSGELAEILEGELGDSALHAPTDEDAGAAREAACALLVKAADSGELVKVLESSAERDGELSRMQCRNLLEQAAESGALYKALKGESGDDEDAIRSRCRNVLERAADSGDLASALVGGGDVSGDALRESTRNLFEQAAESGDLQKILSGAVEPSEDDIRETTRNLFEQAAESGTLASILSSGADDASADELRASTRDLFEQAADSGNLARLLSGVDAEVADSADASRQMTRDLLERAAMSGDLAKALADNTNASAEPLRDFAQSTGERICDGAMARLKGEDVQAAPKEAPAPVPDSLQTTSVGWTREGFHPPAAQDRKPETPPETRALRATNIELKDQCLALTKDLADARGMVVSEQAEALKSLRQESTEQKSQINNLTDQIAELKALLQSGGAP